MLCCIWLCFSMACCRCSTRSVARGRRDRQCPQPGALLAWRCSTASCTLWEDLTTRAPPSPAWRCTTRRPTSGRRGRRCAPRRYLQNPTQPRDAANYSCRSLSDPPRLPAHLPPTADSLPAKPAPRWHFDKNFSLGLEPTTLRNYS